MANPQGLVHPQMLERLRPNFYPSSCTVQAATTVANSFGELIKSWSNLPDHVNLACRVAPTSGREQRSQEQLYSVHQWTIGLAGHYPGISETMRAVVNGQAYDIEAVQHDGQSKTTRLLTRIVT